MKRGHSPTVLRSDSEFHREGTHLVYTDVPAAAAHLPSLLVFWLILEDTWVPRIARRRSLSKQPNHYHVT